MATYLYDDFRVTFTPAADGGYDVRARDVAGAEATGRFVTPLTDDELRDAVLGVARATRARAATRRRESTPDAASPRRPGRDVGDDPAPSFDAEHVGGALATALLGGPIGVAYDRAAAAARSNGRGIRLDGDAEPPVFATLDTGADGLAVADVRATPSPVSERGEVLEVAL